MRGSEWITVVLMEMVLILVMVMMDRPPLGQGGEVMKMAMISPFSAAPEQQDLTPLEGGRGFVAVAASINLGKIRVFLFWRDEGVLKREGRNGARGANR
jgi:hypothetical protein